MLGWSLSFLVVGVLDGFAIAYFSDVKTFLLNEKYSIVKISLAIAIGLGGLFLSGIQVLITRNLILLGPPAAPDRPEEAVHDFIRSIFLALEGPGMDAATILCSAYLLLLDSAKGKAKSFRAFKEYWTKTHERLLKDVRDRLGVKKIAYIKCAPQEPRRMGDESALVIYKVVIQVTGFTLKQSGLGIGNVSEESVGMVCYRERFSVAEVGGRCYLTSPGWSGEAMNSGGK